MERMRDSILRFAFVARVALITQEEGEQVYPI
jgi:hypothetical protein